MRLSHACLQEGTHAATKNIHLFRHNDDKYGARETRPIRANDTENGILLVTESLFSMDFGHAQTSRRCRTLCHEYNATLDCRRGA